MKKILFIGHFPPPLHGVSLMNSYVINSKLINSNFHIDIIDLKFSTSIDGLKKFSFSKVLKAVRYSFEIAYNVVTKKPDLVYFTLCPNGFAFYRDAFYVFLLKFLHVSILFHLHEKGIAEKVKRSSQKKRLYTWVFKNTNIICLTERLREDITDVYKRMPFIVPNGIEVRPNTPGALNRLKRAKPHILFLSNYLLDKGVLVLIEALVILKRQGYLFNARLVGAPGDFTVESLEKLVIDKGLNDQVKILGPLYGDNKFSELHSADIFVFPTYNDVFGLVNLEAMQCSLPVISTYEGSIPDIVVDNETGFIVETRNPDMLAERIALLLNDNDLRLKMGMKGYERFMNNFTISHFENKLNDTFQTILDNK
jgi:glycosyltransferase involved in cell wall biosynthesis